MTAPKPMLATDGKDFSFPSDDSWSQEKKLDGWRFLFHVTETGVRSYAARNGSDRTGQAPAIEAVLATLPNDTILDAELIVPGEQSPRVAHELAHGGDNLKAVVFDMPRMAGRDITAETYDQRRELLVRLADLFSDPVSLIEAFDADEDRHDEWIAAGIEGSVVKCKQSRYEPRKSKSWLKFKAEWTTDAVVIGFQAGKGKWSDHAGAFEIKMVDNGIETTASTATDLIREEIKATPEKYLGKIIEVRHNGLMDSGKPRHPRFIRLRTDLEKEQPMTKVPKKELPAAEVVATDVPWSPVRSPNNPERFRAVKQMKDEKFYALYDEMQDFAIDDPEGYGVVVAEYRRRQEAADEQADERRLDLEQDSHR